MTRFTGMAGGDFAFVIFASLFVIGCWYAGQFVAGVWG